VNLRNDFIIHCREVYLLCGADCSTARVDLGYLERAMASVRTESLCFNAYEASHGSLDPFFGYLERTGGELGSLEGTRRAEFDFHPDSDKINGDYSRIVDTLCYVGRDGYGGVVCGIQILNL
jgi:hypothetical protein